MTTEEQIQQLEKRMEKMESQLKDTHEILASMNEELKRITRGIYGDKENDTQGLIERQRVDEFKLRELEQRVKFIEEDKTTEKVKKQTLGGVAEKALKIFGIIMMAYLVLKNVIGVDTLVDLIFKR